MVTLVGYAAWLPVTHGYVSRLRSPIPGYAWLRKLAKNMRNRLRRPLPGILVPTPKILESAWDRVKKNLALANAN